MKYEAFFGDQGLFFDAHRDCEMVGNGHHKVENGKLMVWNFSEKYWAESYTNEITIAAMRRIIEEPKRWTVEDQKAGRLPEVGCRVSYLGIEYDVLAVDKHNVCFLGIDKELYLACISSVKPVETPEEKAQREEDEFVDSESFFIDVCTMSGPMKAAYKQGARAAYRKLKGGE